MRTEFAVVFEGLVGPRLKHLELLLFEFARRAGEGLRDCALKYERKGAIAIALMQLDTSSRLVDEFAFLTRQVGGAPLIVSELSSVQRANFLSQGKQTSRMRAGEGLYLALDRFSLAAGLTRTWEVVPLRLPLLVSHDGLARYDVKNRRLMVATNDLPPVGMELLLEARLVGVPVTFNFAARVTVIERGREQRYGLSIDGLTAEEQAIFAGYATSEAPMLPPLVIPAGQPVARVTFPTEEALEAELPTLNRGELFARGVTATPGSVVTTEVVLPDGRLVPGVGTVVAVEASGTSIEISMDSLFALTRSAVRSKPTSGPSMMETVSALTLQPPDVPPSHFGDYDVLSRLGRGGLADVFYARHVEYRNAVAIKRLSPELASRPDCFELFALEGDVTRQLKHPNIVQTLDVGVHEGEYFLVMELVDGRDLAQVLRKCVELDVRLPVDPVLMMVRCLLDALGYLHDARGPRGDPWELVHCDVAPENLLVSRDGDLKLVDFGVASVRGSGPRGGTTPRLPYLSPEAFDGDFSRARDLWATAVTLYELLARRRPWEGDDAEALRAAIHGSRPPSLASLRTDVPAQLVSILDKALALDPAARFADARSFAAALDEVMNPAVATPLAVASIVRGLFGNALNQEAVKAR